MKKRLIAAVAICLAVLGAIYFPFLNYLEPTEFGMARNWVSGELWSQKQGWNVTPPWTSVARIDTRPMRVCVTTAGRGFNCKLVEFVPSAYKEFVSTEGFYYYWWANRISVNFGYDQEYRGVKDLLRGYAYSIKQYPFVRVLRDYVEP